MNYKCRNEECGQTWPATIPYTRCPMCGTEDYAPERLEEWSVKENQHQERGPVISNASGEEMPDMRDPRWVDQSPDE